MEVCQEVWLWRCVRCGCGVCMTVRRGYGGVAVRCVTEAWLWRCGCGRCNCEVWL